ncbi:hypothetical protein EYZ11_002882 [Aspergillus tanneri]|uniref:Uncharacterized protein n=1 Tax=Aspergillus tanneri TaxID=1220188 RepID=A0A4S3JPS5_9EURO|nr:hypothetical protein EYZ11_002882 [Aspergillus tanneri]
MFGLVPLMQSDAYKACPTPNAMLGYGYRAEHFWYGIEKFAPKAIIVDSGSIDGGSVQARVE